jgi:hypothetical protein
VWRMVYCNFKLMVRSRVEGSFHVMYNRYPRVRSMLCKSPAVVRAHRIADLRTLFAAASISVSTWLSRVLLKLNDPRKENSIP